MTVGLSAKAREVQMRRGSRLDRGWILRMWRHLNEEIAAGSLMQSQGRAPLLGVRVRPDDFVTLLRLAARGLEKKP